MPRFRLNPKQQDGRLKKIHSDTASANLLLKDLMELEEGSKVEVELKKGSTIKKPPTRQLLATLAERLNKVPYKTPSLFPPNNTGTSTVVPLKVQPPAAPQIPSSTKLRFRKSGLLGPKRK